MSGKRSQANASKELKQELLKWICMSHATNSPLSRQLLRKNALLLVTDFGLKGFKCSEAWITVFLKKYGFSTNLTDCSGPKFDDYRIWINLVRPLFMEYSYEDQFHVDELMMYTDFLSPTTKEDQNDSEVVNDLQKTQASFITPAMNRVTLLLACNVSGTENLRPLICGPYHLEEHSDRLYYHAENSLISDELFGSWLSTLNRDMASINRKIVLIMSRKRVNVMSLVQLTHVMPLFIPNEYPAKLKPFRTDVFHYVKMIYRKEYVELLCENTSKSLWNPEKIIDILIQSWKNVPKELIVTSFQRTKFREDDSFLNIECESWGKLMTGVTFKKFVTFDDDLIDTADIDSNSLRFLSSVKKNDTLRSSLSNSSKINDEDQSEISTGDFEESLKRPSDDSLDISGEVQVQNYENMTESHKGEDDDQRLSALFKGQDQEKALNIKNSLEDIPNRMIEPVRRVKSSPIRNASTPVKDYDKEMTRIYPSPEKTSISQSHGEFINDGCFEEITGCLETKLMNLEKNSCQSHNDSPKLYARNLFNSSPIPSTSKEGLEESFILQHLHERLNKVNFYDKINSKEPINFDDITKDDMQQQFILQHLHERFNKFKNMDLNQKNEEKSSEDEFESFKRKRINENDESMDISYNNDEPYEKKQKMELNWAKQYENHLVFGPNNMNQSKENLEIINPDDEMCSETPDLEKKCIFTFSQSPGPSGSY